MSSPKGGADLHCHSTASDGFLSPTELVQRAADLGLGAIALTDHDTLAGLAEATTIAADTGVTVIPGIEMGSNSGTAEVHVLGYYVDASSAPLVEHLAWCQENRLRRIGRICERLAAAGVAIDYDAVLARAGEGSVGRPHVALELIEHGYARSISDAFDRWIGYGRPGYVRRENVDPATAVRIIRQAGGAPVMAHPYAVSGWHALLPELIDAGLAGLEAWYGEYDATTRRHIAKVALAYGLIATGGSDFHGDNFKEGRALGSATVPLETIDALRAAASAS
jgi:predicted metal-dependent phosphoesterase TrpH